MRSLILTIASDLQAYFEKLKSSNEFSIFLCGGSNLEQENYRRLVGDKISQKKSKYHYQVYYPEDLFEELIRGHQKKDLLSLENMLADSTHSVAILVDSPGTFTELGAFSNHERLKNKLILIVEPKYRNAKSFINMGPIRYLQDKSKSEIHYIPMDQEHLSQITTSIIKSCRDISKNSPPIMKLSNPISSYDFYLSLIYVFDPIPKSSLLEISEILSKEDSCDIVITSAETVINYL